MYRSSVLPKEIEVVPQGSEEFPQLEFTNIPEHRTICPGIDYSTELPVVAQEWVSPLLHSMMGRRRLKDLLIGSSEPVWKTAAWWGLIRVYKNSGSEVRHPITVAGEYAKPNFIFNDRSGGTPFSVPQGCCIGTHPAIYRY